MNIKLSKAVTLLVMLLLISLLLGGYKIAQAAYETFIFDDFEDWWPGPYGWRSGWDGGVTTCKWGNPGLPDDARACVADAPFPNNVEMPYPDNLHTWMQLEGLNFSNAVSVLVSFYLDVQAEPNYDYFTVYVKSDGQWHEAYRASTWIGMVDLDLSDIVAGRSNVIFQFRFDSDRSVSPAGDCSSYKDNNGNCFLHAPIVDNVLIKVEFEDPPYAPSSPSPQNGYVGISVWPTLSWQGGDPDNGDIVTYTVKVWDNNGNLVRERSTQNTSYAAGPLSPGDYYRWQVVAQDKLGSIAEGPYWSFVTDISSPSNLQSGNAGDRVVLTWTSVSGADRYEIRRNTSNIFPNAILATLGSSATYYEDRSATPGQKYYYWVGACGDFLCSFSRVTGFALRAPIVSATRGVYRDRIEVQWTSVTGADSYKLYKCNDGAINSCGSPINLGNLTQYVDSGLAPGVTFFYRVQACKTGVGCSDYSNAALGSTQQLPTPPSNVQASDGAYTDRVVVSWSSVSGASEYRLYRCTTTSTSSCGSAIYTGSGTSYNDTSATPGVTYYYRVKACNSAGCSGFSGYDAGYRALSKPSNVQASDGTYTDRVVVSWSSVSGATRYKVYRATATWGTKSYLGQATSTSYDDTSASVGVTYYYWVKACNDYRCSDYSAYDTGYRLLLDKKVYLPLVVRR